MNLPYDLLFQLSNLLIMPFWLLMIFVPHWQWTKRIIGSVWIVVPIALLYALLILPIMPSALADLMNPSLDGIAALIGTPQGATIAWFHFLAFDLFVGRWVYLDAQARGITAWLVSPALFFVLMFGPFGLIIYLLVRAVATRRLESHQS